MGRQRLEAAVRRAWMATLHCACMRPQLTCGTILLLLRPLLLRLDQTLPAELVKARAASRRGAAMLLWRDAAALLCRVHCT